VFLRRCLFLKDLLPGRVPLLYDKPGVGISLPVEYHTVIVLILQWKVENLGRFWLQDFHNKFNENLSLD
jgi:hypothetical protein